VAARPANNKWRKLATNFSNYTKTGWPVIKEFVEFVAKSFWRQSFPEA